MDSMLPAFTAVHLLPLVSATVAASQTLSEWLCSGDQVAQVEEGSVVRHEVRL